MTSMSTTSHILDDFSLDILGQQPSLKLYTQIALVYRLDDGDDTESRQQYIINVIKTGLERLSCSFPWVAGKVVQDSNDNVFKVVPFERIPRMTVKHYEQLAFEELELNGFPFRMLDESAIAPCSTIPTAKDIYGNELAPVFLLQLTFIQGGLILTTLSEHTTMDVTGHGEVLDLLSKACQSTGFEFSSVELSTGNMQRKNLIPLLNYDTTDEIRHQVIRPTSTSPETPPPPPCKWVYFSFSIGALKKLKTEASKDLTFEYVSADDVITAFLWQSIMRSRMPRLDKNVVAKFARAVDARRYLGIPTRYPGLIQNMAYHQFVLKDLLDMPLGHVASNLRAAVDPKVSRIARATRALATTISSSKDKAAISVTASLNLDIDIMLSSWSKIDSYSLDFGLGLGVPVSVRRPQFIPVESLLYLMPKRADGELSAAVCLRQDDLHRLLDDSQFMKYVTYIE